MQPRTRHIIVVCIVALVFAGGAHAKCIQGDCLNGQGKATLAGAKTFTGNFENGKPTGHGIMQYAPGHSIVGNFDGWVPTGNGELTCQNGKKHTINFDEQDKPINDICSPPKKTFKRDPEKEIARKIERMSIHLRNEKIAYQENMRRQAARERRHHPIRQPSISTTSGGGIKARCRQKWGTDYEMVEYCIKNQTHALRNVTSIPENHIKKRCQQKWGTDYEMVEYCYKNQSQAKSRLGM